MLRALIQTATLLSGRFLLTASLIANAAIAQVEADNNLLGHWENVTRGDLVGLELKDKEHCNLYIERALQQRTNRACKYEPFDDRFLIFLFNEQGVCNTEADFEFIYEPEAPLVRLLISGSEIALQKIKRDAKE